MVTICPRFLITIFYYIILIAWNKQYLAMHLIHKEWKHLQFWFHNCFVLQLLKYLVCFSNMKLKESTLPSSPFAIVIGSIYICFWASMTRPEDFLNLPECEMDKPFHSFSHFCVSCGVECVSCNNIIFQNSPEYEISFVFFCCLRVMSCFVRHGDVTVKLMS